MTATPLTRQGLKAACLILLDRKAVEHPAGHQGKLVARYVLRGASGARTGLMFEKGDMTPAYLWVEQRFAGDLLRADIAFKCFPASALYHIGEVTGRQVYGRHAALKSMRDLANADLVRITIDRISQLELILDRLVEI